MNNREERPIPIFVVCSRCRHPATSIFTEIRQREVVYEVHCNQCDNTWEQYLRIPTDIQKPNIDIEE